MSRVEKLVNSQDRPPVYCDAAAAMACKRASFETVWGGRTGIAMTVPCKMLTVEIDTPEDAAWAEFLMSRQVLLADQRESFTGQG